MSTEETAENTTQNATSPPSPTNSDEHPSSSNDGKEEANTEPVEVPTEEEKKEHDDSNEKKNENEPANFIATGKSVEQPLDGSENVRPTPTPTPVHANADLCRLSGNNPSMRHTLGCILGYAPGKIPAFSNGRDDHFSNKPVVFSGLQTGYEWQCVEFARRWLLLRKGVMLPSIHLASHIFYLDHGEFVDVQTKESIEAQISPNGSPQPPVADGLIVYASSANNRFGHVGVITDVGPDWIRVADQNRFFHDWGNDTFAAEFRLERTAAGYRVRDPNFICLGWISFPTKSNRPEGDESILSQAAQIFDGIPPHISMKEHFRFMKKGYLTTDKKASYVGVCALLTPLFVGVHAKEALGRWKAQRKKGEGKVNAAIDSPAPKQPHGKGVATPAKEKNGPANVMRAVKPGRVIEVQPDLNDATTLHVDTTNTSTAQSPEQSPEPRIAAKFR